MGKINPVQKMAGMVRGAALSLATVLRQVGVRLFDAESAEYAETRREYDKQ
jgi:hypothetical protein